MLPHSTFMISYNTCVVVERSSVSFSSLGWPTCASTLIKLNLVKQSRNGVSYKSLSANTSSKGSNGVSMTTLCEILRFDLRIQRKNYVASCFAKALSVTVHAINLNKIVKEKYLYFRCDSRNQRSMEILVILFVETCQCSSSLCTARY